MLGTGGCCRAGGNRSRGCETLGFFLCPRNEVPSLVSGLIFDLAGTLLGPIDDPFLGREHRLHLLVVRLRTTFGLRPRGHLSLEIGDTGRRFCEPRLVLLETGRCIGESSFRERG